LQSKKGKREEAKKKGEGAVIARYGRRKVWTPLSPPPLPKKILPPLTSYISQAILKSLT